jgi:hypothetical protein
VPKPFSIAIDAFWRFNDDDGWAIASHIALSGLMALFPFMIFVTSLAAFFGSKELADNTAQILLDTWPKEVAGPIAQEIHDVLTNIRTDALTFGIILAIYFSSAMTSSRVRRPGRCRVDQHRHVARACAGSSTSSCARARGCPPSSKTSDMHGIDAALDHELVGLAGLLQVGEVRALDALLAHPDDSAHRR